MGRLEADLPADLPNSFESLLPGFATRQILFRILE
jgi:hypothetical protein